MRAGTGSAVHPRLPAVHLVHTNSAGPAGAGSTETQTHPGRMRWRATFSLCRTSVFFRFMYFSRRTRTAYRSGRSRPRARTAAHLVLPISIISTPSPRLLLVLLLDEPLQRRHVLRRAHGSSRSLPRPRQLTVSLRAPGPRGLSTTSGATGAHVDRRPSPAVSNRRRSRSKAEPARASPTGRIASGSARSARSVERGFRGRVILPVRRRRRRRMRRVSPAADDYPCPFTLCRSTHVAA